MKIILLLLILSSCTISSDEEKRCQIFVEQRSIAINKNDTFLIKQTDILILKLCPCNCADSTSDDE